MVDLIQDLQRAVPDLALSQDPGDRLMGGRDLWPRHLLALRQGVGLPQGPRAVLWPRSTDQVAAIVRWAYGTGTPLVPFGGGSGVCGGILPDPTALVVDLKRMDRRRNLNKEAPSVCVEAGQYGLPLEETLARDGFTLGHFPSSISCSTVGGWLAARSAGQCSSRYGKIEDMVVEVECVTGKGEVLRLPRRTQGLNLVDLVVGSEGTLAILTAATLRLHPAPAHRVFSSWSFPTTEQGMVALRNLFQQGLRPAVARLYDPFDAFLARQGSRTTPSKPRRPHHESSEFSDAALRQLLRRPWVFNEFLGHPISEKCLGGALLVLMFEGAETDTRRDLAETTELFRSAGSDLGAKDLGEAPARFWFENRYAVSFRMAPMVAKGIFVDTMEVVAPWSKLSNVYNAVRKALGQTTFVMAHFSHAYADGCCIYFSFAGSASMHLFSRTNWDEACRQTYDETWARALDAATSAGACFAHHHGVGRSKASNLPIELGVGFEALQGIKRAFDPAGILNPGNLGLGSGSHPAAVPPTEISP